MPVSLPPASRPALDRVIGHKTVTLGAVQAIGSTIIQPQAGLTTIRTETLTGRTWSGGVAPALVSLIAAIAAGAPAAALARGRTMALAR